MLDWFRGVGQESIPSSAPQRGARIEGCSPSSDSFPSLDQLLRDYQFNPLQKIARRLAQAWLLLRYPLLRRRHRRLVVEEIDGVPLLILPNVFNPVLLRSGAFLARTLVTLPLADPTALSVLDLGTGSGVGAVFAARRGGRITAVDINPEAVRCARLNADLNQLAERIEVHQGNLFEPVAGRRFDLILFNPPYYRGSPQDDYDRAWRSSPDLFERFIAGLPEMLTPGGQLLLILSTEGSCRELLVELYRAGWRIEPVARRNLINEIETVYRII